MMLDGPADKPPLASSYPDYALEIGTSARRGRIRPRTIPLMHEEWRPAQRLAEGFWVQWIRPAEEYFELCADDMFKAEPATVAREMNPGTWAVELDGQRAAALTFEFAEQIVGWPAFTLEAPAGTVVELMTHEAHALGGPALLNTHFHAWSRFTCREGVNRFEAFDFESLRWLQLHLRNARGPVVIRDVGVPPPAIPLAA